MSAPKSVALYFTEGSADKVYNAKLDQRPDGWAVTFAYGRRGKPLKIGEKIAGVDYETASEVYDKLVSEKTKKGYTEQENGAVFTSSATAGLDTGFRPQLFNEITIDELRDLGDDWLLQEKHDGERRPMIFEADKAVFANRKGLETSVQMSVSEAFTKLGEIVGDMKLDSEDMGDHVVIFDVKEHFMLKDGTFKERAAILGHLENTIRNAGLSGVLKVDVPVPARTYVENNLERLMNSGAEGVVVRHQDSIYMADRPSSGGDAVKVKFWADCTCRVTEGRAGKRSVGLELLNNSGEWVGVGNVTIPANSPVPEVTDLVDVKYLYAYDGGSLFQPSYRGKRNDVDEAECRLDRLKFKVDQGQDLAPSF